jgi:site-specific DNA-methyltransferase (adenine-specific)
LEPYWSDDLVTLYHGDCREVAEWLAADVLVTDPPYGRNWKQGDTGKLYRCPNNAIGGIAGDEGTTTRDEALTLWGGGCAVVFGDLMLAPPAGTKQVMVYAKPQGAGVRGATGGFRRDAEAVYLVGPWGSGIGGQSSILTTGARGVASTYGLAIRHGHPHAKPVDVMETLIAACPPGVIADPFAGSGSTLVAARNLGRRAIGIEIDERYAEQAARRLSQMVLA